MPDEDAEYPDYYVKWRNLPYSEATWESGKLIEEENGEQVRQFRMREESRYTPSKSNRVLKHRSGNNTLYVAWLLLKGLIAFFSKF